MAFDILTALQEIHSIGIVHCDIKPQNFLLFGNTGHSDDSFDDNIILKLIDFGLSHFIDPRSGKAYMKLGCGTFQYKAPEIQNDCFVLPFLTWPDKGTCGAPIMAHTSLPRTAHTDSFCLKKVLPRNNAIVCFFHGAPN